MLILREGFVAFSSWRGMGFSLLVVFESMIVEVVVVVVVGRGGWMNAELAALRHLHMLHLSSRVHKYICAPSYQSMLNAITRLY